MMCSAFVSKPGITDGLVDESEDFGIKALRMGYDSTRELKFYWSVEAVRDYQFIETHSDILVKSIQLEMARHLPTKTLWEENPGLTPSFQEVQRQFSEPDPNIEVTYFGTVDGRSVPKSMGLRRDGVFSEDWGPGFYDESLQLVRDIYDLKSQN